MKTPENHPREDQRPRPSEHAVTPLQHEVILRAHVRHEDVATDIMWMHGAVAVSVVVESETVILTTAFARASDQRDALIELRRLGSVTVREPDRRNWAAAWRDGARPTVAGDITITLPDIAAPAGVAHHIVIEPHVIHTDLPSDAAADSPAFGHGGHPTTALLLELLQETTVDAGLVADVGTGTGVLAIAAAVLGATEVHAVDIDPAAVTVATANRSANSIPPDQLHLAVGSVEDLPRPPYDTVLANLTSATLLPMAAQLMAAVSDHGTLLVSGLLEDQEPQALDAFGGFTVAQRTVQDGWLALVLQPPGASGPT